MMRRLKNTEVSIKSKANYHKTYLEAYKTILYTAVAGDAAHFEA